MWAVVRRQGAVEFSDCSLCEEVVMRGYQHLVDSVLPILIFLSSIFPLLPLPNALR